LPGDRLAGGLEGLARGIDEADAGSRAGAVAVDPQAVGFGLALDGFEIVAGMRDSPELPTGVALVGELEHAHAGLGGASSGVATARDCSDEIFGSPSGIRR